MIGIYVQSNIPKSVVPLIKTFENPLINKKIPIKHTLIKEGNTSVLGEISIDKPYPLNGYPLFHEICERCEKVLIILDDYNPALLIYAFQFKKPLKIIIDGVAYDNAKIRQVIQNTPKDVIKKHYDALFSQIPKQYATNELYTTPNGATLRPYQQMLMDFIIQKKRVGLFVDMGLGKTLTTIATIDKLLKDGKLTHEKPILVVAPITVALDTWAREAKKWGYDWDVLINIQLTPKKRQELFAKLQQPLDKLTLVTTNPQQLQHIIDHFGQRMPFQMVIVDELSQFKSPAAKRFEQMSYINRYVPYFIGLTGTPSPNSLLDIWSQMIVIDPKNKNYFGHNFFTYRGRYFEPDIKSRDGKVYRWKLKPGAQKRIFDNLKHTTVSLQSQGLVDLPEMVYSNHYVKLSKTAQKFYDHMDKVLRKELQESENSHTVSYEDVDVANTAVLKGKLIQLASGAVYKNDGSYEIYHSEKTKALIEIAENATSPLLVFFYFQHQHDELIKALNSAKLPYEHLDPNNKNFQQIVEKWNQGNIPILLAHPASAGHGLNLQDGGHTAVWLSVTQSNEQYRQANKRLHRSGQKHPVSIIHIIAERTEDENVIKRLDENEGEQQHMLNTLQTYKPTQDA